MTSIPFQSALSLLSAVASASQHPAFQSLQKAAPTTSSIPVTVASAPPQASAPVPAPAPASTAPSAPMNVSGASAAPNASNSTPASSPPSTSMNNNLCEVCHVRPKYHDGTKTHPFCSKTCAANKSKSNGTANASTNAGNCDFCHSRPKYNDGTQTFSFCSKSCARNSKSSGSSRQSSISVSAPQKPTPGLCQAHGCQKPAHKNANGTPGEYCSIGHKTFAESVCLMCYKSPKQGDRHFCGKTCADDAEKLGPAILEVPSGHLTFKSVADQFKASWRHSGTSCPTVRGVYKIVSTTQSLAKYDTYRAAVETRGQFVSAGRSAGNENRRWHGTRRECNFGDPGQTQFCSSATCSLCCIVRTSFDMSFFGKKTGWGRFGVGVYTSSTSSKSNDYATNKSSSPLKAMLLNKVVVGKGYKMLHDNTSLTAPPTGFDSVLAEKGGSLNYDELVVYSNDAIRPSFLVMYDS